MGAAQDRPVPGGRNRSTVPDGHAVVATDGRALAPGGDPTGVDASSLVARTTLPGPGTPLTLGVSGGPDSLGLLVLATEAGCRVTAVHVDHGLRTGSAAEAHVVAEAARRYGAGFRAETVDCAPGPDLEARARAARWAALGPEAMVAHTADDQAETVLANLLRGAGLTGAAGMGTANHPLLGLRRWELTALCAGEGLIPVQDPTNRDPARLRNRLRHEVLPLLTEVAGRDPVAAIARGATLAADDLAVVTAAAADLDPTDAGDLAAAPPAIARAALRRWLREAGDGHPPDADAVTRVLGVARGEAVATEIAGGWRVARSARRLSLHAPSRP